MLTLVMLPFAPALETHRSTDRPAVQLMSDTREQHVAIEDAVDAFAAAGMGLPSVQVVFDSDDESCNGHLGLFQPSLQPWRITICSDLDFVPVHELAHAWIEANVDELTRLRYLELRGSASWNSSEDDWSDRGVEDAAFVIQQNLRAGVTGELNREWEARATAYELLTGSRSPLRVTSSTRNPGLSENGTSGIPGSRS
jgi:hypothetical protein